MSCISGVGDSRSGHILNSHNRDSFASTSMVDSGLQTAQLSPKEPHDSGAEQSNEQRPIILSGMGLWASRQVPRRANFSNNRHTTDGKRHSFNCRPANNKREGFTVDPSQTWSSVPMANNTARPNLGTYLQGVEYQTDQCALGIDQDLAGPDFSKEYGFFAEDANNTKTDDFANRQNLSRHMHEHHEEQFQYNCQLSKDGLDCTGHVKKRNRRRHVEVFHPKESTELPPISNHRRPNPQTDEMLNRWFVEVLQSISQ